MKILIIRHCLIIILMKRKFHLFVLDNVRLEVGPYLADSHLAISSYAYAS